MEVKHTPEPWAYDETTGCIYYADDDVEPTIAVVDLDNVGPEQAKADGHLLSAAPELLAACDAAMDSIARIRCAYPETQSKHAYDMAVKAETLIRVAMDKAMPRKPVDYSRGKYWNIEQMPNGRWVLWDKRDGFMDAVQSFDTEEEAEDWADAMDYQPAADSAAA